MSHQIISRATMRARGADAFDAGLGVNDHHMNPGSPAIEDWQIGWRKRQAEKLQARYDRATRPQAQVCLVEAAEP